MPRHKDLFASVVADHRLHPQFRALRDSVVHAEARALMSTFYKRMGDPNGNFVDDFQADGFHSRLFELACFAYLEEAGMKLDRTDEAPDFLASRTGTCIAIEATTANPPTGRATDICALKMEQLSMNEISEKVEVEFPRRMRSILRKKLERQYHKLPQCQGKPLVLMVAPFFEAGATFYTDEALIDSLYRNSGNAKAFFLDPNAAAISAVVYCNAFTVPRFFRLATRLDEKTGMNAIRKGTCYEQYSETQFSSREFEHCLGSTSVPRETWSEGVTLFLNPNASTPIPPGFLPNTSTLSVRGGYLIREVHGFHPVTSFMVVEVSADRSKLPWNPMKTGNARRL